MDILSSVGASVFAGVFLVARDLTEKNVNICPRKSKSKPKTESSCLKILFLLTKKANPIK